MGVRRATLTIRPWRAALRPGAVAVNGPPEVQQSERATATQFSRWGPVTHPFVRVTQGIRHLTTRPAPPNDDRLYYSARRMMDIQQLRNYAYQPVKLKLVSHSNLFVSEIYVGNIVEVTRPYWLMCKRIGNLTVKNSKTGTHTLRRVVQIHFSRRFEGCTVHPKSGLISNSIFFTIPTLPLIWK